LAAKKLEFPESGLHLAGLIGKIIGKKSECALEFRGGFSFFKLRRFLMSFPEDDRTLAPGDLREFTRDSKPDNQDSTLAPGSTVFDHPKSLSNANQVTANGPNESERTLPVGGSGKVSHATDSTLPLGEFHFSKASDATLLPGGLQVDSQATLPPNYLAGGQGSDATLPPNYLAGGQGSDATLPPNYLAGDQGSDATLPPNYLAGDQGSDATLPPGFSKSKTDLTLPIQGAGADSLATIGPAGSPNSNDEKTLAPGGGQAKTFPIADGAKGRSSTVRMGDLKGGKTEPQSQAVDSKGARLPIVPGYELLGELGRGGMGVVYRARQRGLGRMVALKMVLNSQASQEELDRFMLEAHAVATVEHPNIVQIYDVGEYKGLPYFSLEFVDGGPLDSKLNNEPQDPVFSATIMAKVCRAMGFAHSKKILHRDLKPANVLLTKGGEPKITDFGLAKQMDAPDEGHTKAGSIMGTPSYMPPEQAEGKAKDLTNLADVYSLGALLYEFITGRPPFKGRTLLETLQHVRTKEPVAPSQLQPSVPPDLQTVCLKALEKDPAKRYPSAEEMAEDLEAYLRGDPIKARPTSRLEKTLRWARRNKPQAALIAMGFTMFFLMITSGFVFLGLDAHNQRLRAERFETIEGQRKDAEVLLLGAIDKGEKGDWGQSLAGCNLALVALGDSTDLNEIRQRIQEQFDLSQAHIETDTRAAQFDALVEKAYFSATDLTGKTPFQNTDDVLEYSEGALRLFGVGLGDEKFHPKFGEHFLEAQKKRILEECGALLLLISSRQLDKDFNQNKSLERALAVLNLAKQAGSGEKIRHLYMAQYHQALSNRGDKKHQALADAERLEASKVDPQGPREWFFLGDELFRKGEFEKASEAFAKASRLRPIDFWPTYYQAVSAIRTESWAEARALLLNCLGKKDNFGFCHVLIGITEGKLKQFDDSKRSFDRAVALLGGETQGVLVNRGAMFFDQGKLQNAEQDLRKSIKLEPNNWIALDNLGVLLRSQQKYLEAETCFLQAEKVAGKELGPMRHLAGIMGELDPPRWNDSGKILEKVVAREKDPSKLANDLMALARVKIAEMDLDGARAILDKALGYDKQNALIWLLNGWVVNEIASKKDLVNRSSSLADYKLALESYNRGFELAAQGKSDEVGAKVMADYFKKLSPKSEEESIESKLLRARGFIKDRLGDYGSALADYTRSLELNRNQSGLRTRRGMNLITNWRAIALEDFNQGIKLNPNDRELYAGRCYVEALEGNHKAAAKDAGIATGGMGSVPWHVRVNTAAGMAQAYRVAKNPPRGGIVASPETQERYLVMVWGLLEKAMNSQPSAQRASWWSEYIESDDAFDPVRGMTEWNDLKRRSITPAKPG